jgi:Tfp pilus assembly protein FimT
VTTPVENQSKRERSWIYITAIVLLSGMAVWAIIAFSAARETNRAEEKADELIAVLQDAGARTPDKDRIVRVFGDDGGAACANPNEALSRATLLSLLSNGATGPGARPVIADSRAVQGQLLIMEVYCPEELDEFKVFVDNLKTENLTGS